MEVSGPTVFNNLVDLLECRMAPLIFFFVLYGAKLLNLHGNFPCYGSLLLLLKLQGKNLLICEGKHPVIKDEETVIDLSLL